MKVVVVTGFTPTPENTRGISGLLYAILKYRPEYIDLKIISFNFNKISIEQIKELEKDLQSSIMIQRPPRWVFFFNNIWGWRFNKFFMSEPLECSYVSKSLIKNVRKEHPDLIWCYPYFFYRLANKMPDMKVVLSGCDCEALINVRKFVTKSCLKGTKALRHTYIMLKRGLHFESRWNEPNLKIHFVGEEDKCFYERVYGYHNAYFIRHPHYSLHDKEVNFNKPKLKVIMTGGYDIYTEDDVDMMLPNLIKYNDELHLLFEFTILGKNWEPLKRKFEACGFECTFKTWVDDYAQELVQHDIQIAPISYGTGTKGKVLSALGNGLLVVGSKFAFENIEVVTQESCVQYQKASDVAELLLNIAYEKDKYQAIALKGRAQVRNYHNPKIISKEFFETYGR